MLRIALCLAACLTTSGSLLAHPGHGVTDASSPAHYILEPLHIAPVLIVATAAAVVFWLLRRKDDDDDLRRERVRKR